MNLNAKLKELIVKRFLDGASILTLSLWYEKPVTKIEDVIRDAFQTARAPQADLEEKLRASIRVITDAKKKASQSEG